ncbi:hypothetical protein EJ05DRAFT_476215 [Pseudovirgaria hyperparasitica]|uniref:Uncharacterized protein n=1 Tax=Pseudovirgaria hyperparasitica TaxID=470096 RepID=A0A6A6W5V0_9PEZI|nr:uncharacterized protein EJ05DRAFT_476215 [Pseudovirgaria hyperparasitica]KAF2757925.1 hypothetical protein EJ05DRAFT_476215 [Pseudovirgaria hyperparasitica]
MPHLNPRRHWRDHPAAFISQKQQYADEQALVFHDIDYIMITIRLLMKDYVHLAQRLVPIGRQMDLTISETAELLKRKTRAFGEEEIRAKFGRV